MFCKRLNKNGNYQNNNKTKFIKRSSKMEIHDQYGTFYWYLFHLQLVYL